MDARIRKSYDAATHAATATTTADVTRSSPDREVKRESRLTSIIDQLLSTKTRASDKTSDCLSEHIDHQQSSEESDFEEDDEVERVLKRPASAGNTSTHSSASSPRRQQDDDSDLLRTKYNNRKSKYETMLTATHSNVSIKSERLSPEDASQDRADSSSSSPPFTSTPSPRLGMGLGMGLGPAVSAAPPPSYDRGSVGGIFPELTAPPPGLPAATAAGLLNFGAGCTNYSDFIRGLAAKYNNNNNNGGSIMNNDSLGQTNCFFRGFGNYPTFKTPTPPPVSKNLSALMDFDKRKLEGPLAPGVDLQTSQALLNIVRSASAQSASQLESYLRTSAALKRPSVEEPTKLSAADPLDLTTGTAPVSPSNRKRSRLDTGCRQNGSDVKPIDWSQILQSRQCGSVGGGGGGATTESEWSDRSDRSESCKSSCTNSSCSESSQATEVHKWSVEDVCSFVTSVDTCAEYATIFREQSIDGAVLPLLTEEHLTSNFKMKLGPAIKLRSTLARKIGHCAVCMHCVHCHGPQPNNNNNDNDNAC